MNDGKQIKPDLSSEVLRQYRTMIVVQLRRRIFVRQYQLMRQESTPLPTKAVKYDGIEASICAIKVLVVHPAVLP